MTSKSRFFRELSDYNKAGPLEESSYTATSTCCTMVAMDLAAGMAVHARFQATEYGKERTKMYPGRIELVHPDGFVKVRYKDGDVEEKVNPCWVKKPNAKRGSILSCGGSAKHPRAQLPSSIRGTGIEESSGAAATAATGTGSAAEAYVQPAPPAVTSTIKHSVTSNSRKTTAIEDAEVDEEGQEAEEAGCLPTGVYRRASTPGRWVSAPVEAAEAVDQHPDDQTQPATATAPLAPASTEVVVGSRVKASDGTCGVIVARNGAWLAMRTDAGEERSVRRRSVEVIAVEEGAQALALLVGCEVVGGVVPSVPLRAAAREEPSASTEPAATADVDKHSGIREVLRETAGAAAAAATRAAAAAAAAVAVDAGADRALSPAVSDVGEATAKGGVADGGAAAGAQAETKHHRRNEQPARIVECGFVEAPALLPATTCDKLYSLDRSAAVLISNARQLSVQGAELRLVESALEQSPQVRQTVLAVFGTEEFIVPKDSLKVGGPHHAHPAPHARASSRGVSASPRAPSRRFWTSSRARCRRSRTRTTHATASSSSWRTCAQGRLAPPPSQPACHDTVAPASRLAHAHDRPRPSVRRTSATPTTQ